MLYPFIYTRTKYHDYRIVTSKSLTELPHSVVQICTEVARTMIDAENEQLREPSWAFVRKEGYTLWGMSILNETLGDDNKDKYNRPVRGFFGFISDNYVSKLPYSISYFKEIYKAYVMPIWDSPEQTEQIRSQLPAISGDEFITKSSTLYNKINFESGMCRIFPYGADCKGLIQAVFGSFEDCSIATNIHNKRNFIEFGKDKLTFMNVVGAPDSGIRDNQEIKVYTETEPVNENNDLIKEDSTSFDDSTSISSGTPLNGEGGLCPECDNKKKNGKGLKYGLYGFIAIILIALIFEGPKICETIFSPRQSHFIIPQEGKIMTPEVRYETEADSSLRTSNVCESLDKDRDGDTTLVTEGDKNISIPEDQTVSNGTDENLVK